MSESRLTILIIGGYGTFGGRLVRLLSDEPRLTVLVAGRSAQAASRFCAALPAVAQLRPLRFDREGDLRGQLALAQPDLLIDATGPFQAYGGDPYKVVRACLDLGIDYLDLADGSAFVRGIEQFDAAAKARATYVLSGASSVPALSGAVVRHLSTGLTPERVTGGIAPSPHARVGPNVLRAIAGYAGQAIALWRHGRLEHGYALTETCRRSIAPPGRLPLHNRLFALVDVPDLQMLPLACPGLASVWFGAGPVPEILHRMFIGLAWLVRLGLLRSLSPFAGSIARAGHLLHWGEDRGGMFVAVRGTDAAGAKVERSWHLVAEGDDGPFIPAMASEALVRHHVEGQRPAPGARSAIDALDLADFDALFSKHAIHTGCREVGPDSPRHSLYRRLLGDAWLALPEPLRALHGPGLRRAAGRASVERGTGLLARAVAAAFGFPGAGHDVPVEVSFTPIANGEIWRRDFAGRVFSSTQTEGRGRFEHLVVERFGPVVVGLALVVEPNRLRIIVRRCSVFGIPVPLAWAPGGPATESVDDGRFRFSVEIGHPLCGLIVRYRGWLALSGGEPAERS